MKKIKVKCPAKVNLFLNIVKKDGAYHKMHMINTSVSLCDVLTIEKTKDKIEITCDNSAVPTNEENSIYKITKLFLEYTKVESGVKIHIEKKIPLSSGLGGESTDAAGTIIGLNKLFETNLTEKELLDLGFKIGCDVPFSISGGTKEVSGYGEELTNYSIQENFFLIITPDKGYSTKEMFKKYDELNDYEELEIKIGHNDFHKVLDKEDHDLMKLVLESGARISFLTGSGSSIIGLYNNQEELDSAFERLKNTLKDHQINKANYQESIELED